MSGRLAGGSDDGFSLTELLVVIVLLGLVGAAAASVVVTTSRTHTVSSHLREVMDDARFSVDQVRKEVREARRVEAGSDENTLIVWTDQNQDNIRQAAELVTFDVVPGGGGWFLTRERDGSTQVAAQTLINPVNPAVAPGVFRYVTPAGECAPPTTVCPTDIRDTRALVLDLVFDVSTNTGTGELPVLTTIRIRNVA